MFGWPDSEADACLLLKTGDNLRFLGKRIGQDLDRKSASVSTVSGEENMGHPATADKAHYLIVSPKSACSSAICCASFCTGGPLFDG